MTHFGTFDNSGPSADLSDPDGDNLVNLVEFLTGSDPRAATPAAGHLVKNGNAVEWTFTRRIAAMAELNSVTEFSGILTNPWTPADPAAESVLNDDGVFQNVMITVPQGSSGRQFVRLRVTRK
jgi:hypothetical protein